MRYILGSSGMKNCDMNYDALIVFTMFQVRLWMMWYLPRWFFLALGRWQFLTVWLPTEDLSNISNALRQYWKHPKSDSLTYLLRPSLKHPKAFPGNGFLSLCPSRYPKPFLPSRRGQKIRLENWSQQIQHLKLNPTRGYFQARIAKLWLDIEWINLNLFTAILYRGEIGRVVLTEAFQWVVVSGRIFPAGPGSFWSQRKWLPWPLDQTSKLVFFGQTIT